MRTHIIIAEELIKDVDRVAGKRKRSRFIEEAIREKLARDDLDTIWKKQAGILKGAGILNPADYPEWETPEKTSAWVRALRRPGLEQKTGDESS